MRVHGLDVKPATCKKARQTTSAIPGTEIYEVRRSLKKMRKFADEALPTQPFCITDMLTANDSVERFALRFVLGHHMKRSNRVKRTSVDEDVMLDTRGDQHTTDADGSDEVDGSDDEDDDQVDDDDGDVTELDDTLTALG